MKPERHQVNISGGGHVLGLVANVGFATRIAKAAKHNGLSVHNFDKAHSLVARAKEKKPILVILDWDGLEAEAFQVLDGLKRESSLERLPVIGFCNNPAAGIKDVAERAGCDRVYTKSDFMRHLEEILMRYAL